MTTKVRARQHFGELLLRGEPWRDAAPWKSELLLSLFLFSKAIHCLPIRSKSSNWRNTLDFTGENLEPASTKYLAFCFWCSIKPFTVSSDGNGKETYAHQTRDELESRRTEKTSQRNTKRADPWDRVQCTMGEDRIQWRTDEPESK